MKLKNFLGAITALTLIASSVPTFAADSDFLSVGTPYDITTGEYTTDLVAGHVIAVPVDIQSTTDALTSYNFEVIYEGALLKAASDVNNFTDDMWTNLETLTGSQKYDNTNVDDLVAINSLGQKRGSNFNEYGSFVVNPESWRVSVVWYDIASRNVNDDAPELYVIFDVVNSTDALNRELFTINPLNTSISDTLNGKEDTISIPNETTKANACDGAFKIVVDSEKLPYWVQKVTVDAKGTRVELDACVNSDGTTLYSFPVRFISENEVANADIEIYATVSDDESGATNVREVNWGAVNVDMSGTVTDYAEANPTIE